MKGEAATLTKQLSPYISGGLEKTAGFIESKVLPKLEEETGFIGRSPYRQMAETALSKRGLGLSALEKDIKNTALYDTEHAQRLQDASDFIHDYTAIATGDYTQTTVNNAIRNFIPKVQNEVERIKNVEFATLTNEADKLAAIKFVGEANENIAKLKVAKTVSEQVIYLNNLVQLAHIRNKMTGDALLRIFKLPEAKGGISRDYFRQWTDALADPQGFNVTIAEIYNLQRIGQSCLQIEKNSMLLRMLPGRKLWLKN